MKILYVVPGTMSRTTLGSAELKRRQKILQDRAGSGVKVDISDIPTGPSSIESAYEEYLAIPETVARIVQAEKQGYDGVILGCFGDPGLDAIREMASIPTVGPGETSLLTACILGHRFSIVTVLDTVIPSLEKLVRMVGVEQKLASIRPTGIAVLELAQNPETSHAKMVDESLKARDHDRTDVIILGCMSMAFLMVSEDMQEALGIPVINPAILSLKILEGLIQARLSHSKKAYPFPPKPKP